MRVLKRYNETTLADDSEITLERKRFVNKLFEI